MLQFSISDKRFFHEGRPAPDGAEGGGATAPDLPNDNSVVTTVSPELIEQLREADDPDEALTELANSDGADLDQEIVEELRNSINIPPDETSEVEAAEYEKSDAFTDAINKFENTETIKVENIQELLNAYKAVGGTIQVDEGELQEIATYMNDAKADFNQQLDRLVHGSRKYASFLIKNGLSVGAAALALSGGPVTALVVGLAARGVLAMKLPTKHLADQEKFNNSIDRQRELVDKTWKRCTIAARDTLVRIGKARELLNNSKTSEEEKEKVKQFIRQLEQDFRETMTMAGQTIQQLEGKINTAIEDREDERRLSRAANAGDTKALQALKSGMFGSRRTQELLNDPIPNAFDKLLEQSGFKHQELRNTTSILNKDYDAATLSGLAQSGSQMLDEGSGDINTVRAMRAEFAAAHS